MGAFERMPLLGSCVCGGRFFLPASRSELADILPGERASVRCWKRAITAKTRTRPIIASCASRHILCVLIVLCAVRQRVVPGIPQSSSAVRRCTFLLLRPDRSVATNARHLSAEHRNGTCRAHRALRLRSDGSRTGRRSRMVLPPWLRIWNWTNIIIFVLLMVGPVFRY